MNARDIAILVLLAGLLAFAIAYVLVGRPARRAQRVTPAGDIPLALRPYHSDEELEGRGLERAMAWGVALVVFMAVFIPVYWILEPQRIQRRTEEFYREDVELGRELFQANCSSCHGAEATGGFAPHPDPTVDAPWPAPNLRTIAARYADNDNVIDLEAFMITTVAQGRPGTPMPAWSAFYGGAMNDQQIESIVRYLLAIQMPDDSEPQAMRGASGEEIFQVNCSRCHGEGAAGGVGPELVTVFSRFGASGDEESVDEAREAIRHTIVNGRIVPTGASMPPWGDALTEDAIDRLVRYLESIQEGA